VTAAEVVAEARRLARRSPKTRNRRSLRVIAAELAQLGYFAKSGRPYGADSVPSHAGWQLIAEGEVRVTPTSAARSSAERSLSGRTCPPHAGLSSRPDDC
jgi:hypothetical protein